MSSRITSIASLPVCSQYFSRFWASSDVKFIVIRLSALFLLEVVKWGNLSAAVLFRRHALMKATGKDYVKDIQVRLILKPVIDGLLHDLRSKKNIESRLTQILATLREESPLEPGYTAGNIFNILGCSLSQSLSNL